jgi:hypothetical protein
MGRRKTHPNSNSKMKQRIERVQSEKGKAKLHSNRKEIEMKTQRNPTRSKNDTAALGAVIKKVASQGLVRHVNGNTLDNREENLQRDTVSQSFQPLAPTVS